MPTSSPPSDDRTRELGARYTSGDECYPAKVTVGDFMKLLERPDIDPAEGAAVHAHGRRPVPLRPVRALPASRFWRPTATTRPRSSRPPATTPTAGWASWPGPSCAPAGGRCWPPTSCRRCCCSYRPARGRQGRRRRGLRGVPGRPLRDHREVADRAARTAAGHARQPGALPRPFPAVPIHRDPSMPLIGVVGEIFCRLNTFSNDDLVRRLEEYGGEAWLSATSPSGSGTPTPSTSGS